MEFELYRNMSKEEARGVLETGCFRKPTNKIYLPRKWFSTSLFRSHYFKSPFYMGDIALLKVNVNEDFFKRIFTDGTFILKEPNGFYGYDEVTDEILYAKAHKTISCLYNVGFLNLEELNGAISDIREISDEEYCSYLEKNMLGQEIGTLPREEIDEEMEFYFQVSYDIAVLILKYQTLLVEAINPVIKNLHFSKCMKDLKKNNLNKYSVTLKIRFKPEMKRLSLYNEDFFSLNYNEILKVLIYVDRICVADLQPPREFREYLHIQGDNTYIKHEKRELPEIERLSFLEFQEVTENMMKREIDLGKLVMLMPFLRDMKDVNQVDPRHIDNVETHTWKSLNMSNLVINYFKNQGVNFDATMLVYIKWILLLHDAGKPYCECDNITTRYSQFGEKEKYTRMIIDKVLDDDIGFDIGEIYRLFSMSSMTQHKKIRKLIYEILGSIEEFYKVPRDEAFKVFSRYLMVALIAKVSHTASMKPHSYCSNYVDDIMYFDRINDVIIEMRDNSFVFSYDDYYACVDTSYEAIVEEYYVGDRRDVLLQILRKIPCFDYNDLEMSYHNKIWKMDIEQLEPDEIVSTYFKDDNELFDKYFQDKLGDKKVHGDEHGARVFTYSYIMGREGELNNDDMEILALTSKYHDKGRNNNGKNHGAEEARYLKELGLVDESLEEYVYFLIEAHGIDDKEVSKVLGKYCVDRARALKLWAIFKDADALDRVRFDSIDSVHSALDMRYLRTSLAHRLVKFACVLNAMFRRDSLDMEPSIKALVKR